MQWSCLLTLERNRTTVPSVKNHLVIPAIWWGTWESTLGRNHSRVDNLRMGQSQEASGNSYWSKAIQVCHMRQVFCIKWTPEVPHAHPHWGETIQVYSVQQIIPQEWKPEDTHAHPHRRKATRMWSLWQVLFHSSRDEEAHSYPLRRETTQVC